MKKSTYLIVTGLPIIGKAIKDFLAPIGNRIETFEKIKAYEIAHPEEKITIFSQWFMKK